MEKSTNSEASGLEGDPCQQRVENNGPMHFTATRNAELHSAGVSSTSKGKRVGNVAKDSPRRLSKNKGPASLAE